MDYFFLYLKTILLWKERMETMVNIIKEEIILDESLKKKLKFICDFAKVKKDIKVKLIN